MVGVGEGAGEAVVGGTGGAFSEADCGGRAGRGGGVDCTLGAGGGSEVELRQTSPDQVGPPGRGTWMVHKHSLSTVPSFEAQPACVPLGATRGAEHVAAIPRSDRDRVPPLTEHALSPDWTLNSTGWSAKSSSRHRTHCCTVCTAPGSHGACWLIPPSTGPPPGPSTTVDRRSPEHTWFIDGPAAGESPCISRRAPPTLSDPRLRSKAAAGRAEASMSAQVLPGLGHDRATGQYR